MNIISALTLEHWSAWPMDFLDEQPQKILPDKIPPMLRRRCSVPTKAALQVSYQALADQEVDYLIFASQHGELSCALNLLKNIAAKEFLSPTSFVASVHNTAAGLFSILNKFSGNSTSLAAGKASFLMAIIEGCAWLQLNPDKKLLLTVFDECMPEEYETYKNAEDFSYAVSLLLSTRESAESLKIILDNNQQPNEKNIPLALEFLSWFLSADQTLAQSSAGQRLTWSRVKQK